MIETIDGKFTRRADIGGPRDLGRMIDGGPPPFVSVTLLHDGVPVITLPWRAIPGHADNPFPKMFEGRSYCCECNERVALERVPVRMLLEARAKYDEAHEDDRGMKYPRGAAAREIEAEVKP